MSDFSEAMIMDPRDLIRQIESYGFTLFVGDDGAVHGRPVVPGTKVPWEMRPLLDHLQLQNEAVAQIIRDRQREIVDLDGISQEDAQPWLDKVKAGEYRLVPGTRVTYVRATKLTYMKLEKVNTNG